MSPNPVVHLIKEQMGSKKNVLTKCGKYLVLGRSHPNYFTVWQEDVTCQRCLGIAPPVESVKAPMRLEVDFGMVR